MGCGHLTAGNPPEERVVPRRERSSRAELNHFPDIFYIDGGLMRGIYTAMYYVDPNRAVPNWPPYDGNFPLAESFEETC